jgi:hypothetical protein
MVGLDHERALLSKRREDSHDRRLIVVYSLVRIRELLPKFTFFEGELVLGLGHSGLDLSVGGIHGSGGCK